MQWGGVENRGRRVSVTSGVVLGKGQGHNRPPSRRRGVELPHQGAIIMVTSGHLPVWGFGVGDSAVVSLMGGGVLVFRSLLQAALPQPGGPDSSVTRGSQRRPSCGWG